MARYSSYGNLDDQIVEDLDMGFALFNNRLRPDQLKAGQLADSQNGRMGTNGEWQTRSGNKLITAPLSAGGAALKLPFFITQQAILTDDLVNGLYGSLFYSNPNYPEDSYIIMAGNSQAKAVSLSNPEASVINISYPNNIAISAPVSMLQVFNKVFIFRAEGTALTIPFTLPTTGQIGNGVTAYIFDNSIYSMEWNGTLTGSPAFTQVQGGSYAQPVSYESNSNTSISDGTVTVTQTAHGLSVGDVIYVTDASTTGLSETTGYFIRTIVSANQFNFLANVPNHGSHSVKYMKKQSTGLGFCHMPSPPWATYHSRRLWMPFQYVPVTINGSVTYETRNVVDEIIASDILDSDTYDQVYNQFRFNAGTSDFVVALHSFAEDKLVVLNRNSIHIVLSGVDISQSTTQLITNEVGCLARRSVLQVADAIIFLSDNGIYATSFQDLYNLRGSGVPLSLDIDSTIKRINKANAHKAIAAYFDNRYYLAVPLNPIDPTLPRATENNAILVYNFLNRGWESIDTVNSSLFVIANLLVGGFGNSRNLYIVSDTGGLYQMEGQSSGIDEVVESIGQNKVEKIVQGVATTRMYNFGITDRKKWNSFEMQIESSPDQSSNGVISFNAENADSDVELGSISSYLSGNLAQSEDAIIRGRIGSNRSYGLQLTLETNQGKPKLRSTRISGSITARSTQSTQ